jgi:hypothetical protein
VIFSFQAAAPTQSHGFSKLFFAQGVLRVGLILIALQPMLIKSVDINCLPCVTSR